MEKVAGKLEVGLADDTRHIVIRLHDLKPDSNGEGRISLLPRYARHLANVLIDCAADAEAESTSRRSNQLLSKG
jgi:hypothetical protein